MFSDFSLFDKMNIESDICIANQCNSNRIESTQINGFNVKLISTKTRGVGINRNLSVSFAEGAILLFADDDIVYHSGYSDIISNEFLSIKNADVIVFGMRFIKNGKIYEIDKLKRKRLHMFNGLGFGTYAIAIKKSSLLKANIKFTELFGGGSVYGSGEDSLFLIDCFRKKLKVFSSDKIIGDNIRDSSSWFTGYNKKFFFDKGAFIACAFPKIRFFLIAYYFLAFRREKEVKARDKIKMMKAGIKGFKKTISFKEWCSSNEK